MDRKPTLVELEMSRVWAESHPDLFVKAVNKFAVDWHWKEYKHDIDFSRNGFITLSAKLWEKGKP